MPRNTFHRVIIGLPLPALFLCGGLSFLCGLRFNDSPSMPLGVWRTVSDTLHRGAVVEIAPPDSGLFRVGFSRGYLHPQGFGAFQPILKTVAAMPGDTVLVDGRGISVNGSLIRQSRPLRQDSAGRPLSGFPAGSYPVPPGQIWIVSGYNARSWDSRYYGPVSIGLVKQIDRPLWVFK